jgi:SagB-type dehydrogenase family enzyme
LRARDDSLPVDLVQLLEHRQTRREFAKELNLKTLGELLWLVCRNRSSRTSELGFSLESRPHPSAGAIHPVHVLVSRGTRQPWFRYVPVEHALVEVPETEGQANAARAAANRLVPIGRALLLGFVAEPGKTAAKYQAPASLVWRDAGVLLGYLSFVAEALRLSFCPLGITGDPYLTDTLRSEGELHGVGMALIGSM